MGDVPIVLVMLTVGPEYVNTQGPVTVLQGSPAHVLKSLLQGLDVLSPSLFVES